MKRNERARGTLSTMEETISLNWKKMYLCISLTDSKHREIHEGKEPDLFFFSFSVDSISLPFSSPHPESQTLLPLIITIIIAITITIIIINVIMYVNHFDCVYARF